MAEGKVPYTVGVAPLLEEARWWMSLIFTPEFSSFSHNRSCFCSHRLWPLQWFSMAGNRLWPRAAQGKQSCASLAALLSLIKDSWSSLAKAAGTPWGRGAGTSHNTWMNACLIHFPVSIPSEYIFWELLHLF